MATKNKTTKLMKRLKEEYFSSLGLSTLEQTELENTKREIAELEEAISLLSASIDRTAAEIEVSTDNRPYNEIQKEIEDLNYYAATFQRILDIIKEEKRLNAIDKNSLTDEDRAEKVTLSNEKNSLIKENMDGYTKLSERYGTKMIDEINQKISEELKELNKTIQKRDKSSALISSHNEKIIKLENLKQRKQALEEKSTNTSVDNLDNFKAFLKNKGYSVTHAHQIYENVKNNKPLKIEQGSFYTADNHPYIKNFAKKVIPSAIAIGAGFGIALSLILTSGLVGGSLIMGFIPVSGTPGLTATALATVLTPVGIGASVGAVYGIKGLIKLYYKKRYHNAEKNLEEFVKNPRITEIDHLEIAKLIAKIQKTKDKVLDLNEGNKFARAIKFIPKHILNGINQLRLNHLIKYAEDLTQNYIAIHKDPSITDKFKKKQQLQPILNLLKQIDEIMYSDSQESILYSMLTCKEGKSDENGVKHVHKSRVENVNKFAEMMMVVDGLKSEDVETELKKAKKSYRKREEKERVALEILNGERLIEKRLEPITKQYNNIVETASEFEVVRTVVEKDKGISRVFFSTGESIEIPTVFIDDENSIAKVKVGRTNTTITYENGRTEVIKKPVAVDNHEVVARRMILEKLNDTDVVADYSKKDVKMLKAKIEAWLNNPAQGKIGLKRSSNAGKLYEKVLTIIEQELKDKQDSHNI